MQILVLNFPSTKWYKDRSEIRKNEEKLVQSQLRSLRLLLQQPARSRVKTSTKEKKTAPTLLRNSGIYQRKQNPLHI